MKADIKQVLLVAAGVAVAGILMATLATLPGVSTARRGFGATTAA
jgi:hypothetical protein